MEKEEKRKYKERSLDQKQDGTLRKRKNEDKEMIQEEKICFQEIKTL